MCLFSNDKFVDRPYNITNVLLKLLLLTGPEKELLQLAVFAELHALFPGVHVHIELIGPAIPQHRSVSALHNGCIIRIYLVEQFLLELNSPMSSRWRVRLWGSRIIGCMCNLK